MSILDGLIFGIRKLLVNGAEQPLKSELEIVGTGVSVTQSGEKNVVSIASSSSSGAPTTAHYVVTESDPSLTNAHIAHNTSSIEAVASVDDMSWYCVFGTTSGVCCEGNDSRLSNDRAASGIRTATTLVSCSSAAAPSAGQSLVATSSTAATWQTVCLSSDARLPTTPAELTTGQKLIVSGASVKTSGRLGAWWNCGVVPTANANSTSSVTVLGLDVRPGDPVRILDKTGVFYGAVTPRINQLALTGLKGSLADYRGRIHYKAVNLGSSMARIDVYDSEGCTNRIGYTADFSTATTTTLTLAYTSTGAQGVTGNVYVYNTSESKTYDTVQSIGLFATGICTAYNRSTGLLTFAGQAVSNVPGCILEVWLGDPRLVQVMDLSFGGSYANATSATAFADKQCRTPHWDLPSSTLVQILVRNSTADTTTAPTVNLRIDGNDALSSSISVPATTARASSLVLSNPYYNALSYGSTLEISATKNGTGDARDLEFVIVAVED